MFNNRSFVPENYYSDRPRHYSKLIPVRIIPHYIESTPIYPEERFEECPRVKKFYPVHNPPTNEEINKIIQNEYENLPTEEEISEMSPRELQANLLRELTLAMIEQIQRTKVIENDIDELFRRVELLEEIEKNKSYNE